MTDNLMWILIGSLGVASIGLGNPGVQSALTKATTYIKSFFSRKEEEEDSDFETITIHTTHDVVDYLISQSEGDTEGLMLLSAYGKHLYDRRVPNAQ
jgi:hypothetical protein